MEMASVSYTPDASEDKINQNTQELLFVLVSKWSRENGLEWFIPRPKDGIAVAQTLNPGVIDISDQMIL